MGVGLHFKKKKKERKKNGGERKKKTETRTNRMCANRATAAAENKDTGQTEE